MDPTVVGVIAIIDEGYRYDHVFRNYSLHLSKERTDNTAPYATTIHRKTARPPTLTLPNVSLKTCF
jgi:hypothetical protein